MSRALYAALNDLIKTNSVQIFALEDGRGRAIPDEEWDANIREAPVNERVQAVSEMGFQIVIVTGNLHARKTTYTFGADTTLPFAARLGAESPSVIVVSRHEGKVFACFQTCDV